MLLSLCLQGRREQDDVVEKLNFFLDLLQSYRVSKLDFRFFCAESRMWYVYIVKNSFNPGYCRRK